MVQPFIRGLTKGSRTFTEETLDQLRTAFWDEVRRVHQPGARVFKPVDSDDPEKILPLPVTEQQAESFDQFLGEQLGVEDDSEEGRLKRLTDDTNKQLRDLEDAQRRSKGLPPRRQPPTPTPPPIPESEKFGGKLPDSFIDSMNEQLEQSRSASRERRRQQGRFVLDQQEEEDLYISSLWEEQERQRPTDQQPFGPDPGQPQTRLQLGQQFRSGLPEVIAPVSQPAPQQDPFSGQAGAFPVQPPSNVIDTQQGQSTRGFLPDLLRTGQRLLPLAQGLPGIPGSPSGRDLGNAADVAFTGFDAFSEFATRSATAPQRLTGLPGLPGTGGLSATGDLTQFLTNLAESSSANPFQNPFELSQTFQARPGYEQFILSLLTDPQAFGIGAAARRIPGLLRQAGNLPIPPAIQRGLLGPLGMGTGIPGPGLPGDPNIPKPFVRPGERDLKEAVDTMRAEGVDPETVFSADDIARAESTRALESRLQGQEIPIERPGQVDPVTAPIPDQADPFDASTLPQQADPGTPDDFLIPDEAIAQQDGIRISEEIDITEQRIDNPGNIPPRSLGTPIGDTTGTPPPRRPDIGLDDDLDIPTHESPVRGIIRKWSGARAASGLEIEQRFKSGMRALRTAGVREFTEPTMRDLFRALHGEITPDNLPPQLKAVYSDLDNLRLTEEKDMLDFLNVIIDSESRTLMRYDAENLASRFMAHPSYFPQGWKQPVTDTIVEGGRIGRTPGFAMPRVGTSFSDMLAEGWKPTSWNPYTMMAARRRAGIEYREQVKLVNRFTQRGLALPFDLAPGGTEGSIRKSVGRLFEGAGRELGIGLPPSTTTGTKPWRVPKVGPVFEGRQIIISNPSVQGIEPQITSTKPIAVPNEVADFLEDAYGASAGSGAEFFKTIRRWSNVPKRVKLFGSLFQHIDITARAAGVAMSPTAISRGAPFKTPSLMGRLLNLQFNPGSRDALARTLTSTTPRYPGGPSYRMLIEEGWGVQGDVSIINRGFTDLLNDSLQDGRTPAKIGKKVIEFWESGLFDGFYRESQRFALDELILPWLKRTRPDSSPRQIAGEAAEMVNLIFSTVENWQTVFQNPAFREAVRSIMFSANESEALIRTSMRALGKHPQAGLFREWWLGFMVATAGLANIINLTATGKPLPLSSYNPANINDPYAPFKIGYSNRFMSPQVPFITGRNGTPVYVDLVGQMDTMARWALDPLGAFSARLNVPPRAILNQIKGETFFGEKLDTPIKRLIQAGIDVAAPISVMNILDIGREQLPEQIQQLLPEQEPRIGPVGQAIQIGGVNLSAEKTPDLLEARSQELYDVPFDDLWPFQQDELQADPSMATELEQRGETAIARGQRGAQYFQVVQAERESAITQINALGREGIRTKQSEIRQDYFDIIGEYAAFKRGAGEVTFTEAFEDDLDDPDPLKQSLAQYYEGLEQSKTPSGLFDNNKWDTVLRRLQNRWSPQQREYVLANTHLLPVSNYLLGILGGRTATNIQASRDARQRRRQNTQRRQPLEQRSRIPSFPNPFDSFPNPFRRKPSQPPPRRDPGGLS